MANASSLNTLYSLINGPNADRIGGFIYNAQVDDAARQREATRQADANIALGNKQAEYSLASALSRSPETAAMFQPGREVLAPDMQDMAYNLTQQVPEMQSAELAGKKADTTYKLAAAGNMQRLASGAGSGGSTARAPVDNTTKEQGAIVARYNTAMNNIASQETRVLQALNTGIAKINENMMLSPTAKQKAIAELQGNTSNEVLRLKDERGRITQTFAPLIKQGMNTPDGQAVPQSPQSVQPTAAPQAAAPQSSERDLRLSQLKAALPKATPEQRTKMLGMAAQYGITPEDLAK